MKMQTISSFRPARQAGFTLIELIVVIVILGILAATALPKFAGLAGEARAGNLGAVKASMQSASSMAHGKFLISGNGNFLVEGTPVAVANGYITAADMNKALSLSSDFAVVAPGNTAGATTGPATTATAPATMAVVPTAVADKTKCYVKYTEATSTVAPQFDIVVTDCN